MQTTLMLLQCEDTFFLFIFQVQLSMYTTLRVIAEFIVMYKSFDEIKIFGLKWSVDKWAAEPPDASRDSQSINNQHRSVDVQV